MSSSFGNSLRVTLFGESHGAAIGMTLDGFPAGLHLDMEALQAFLARRAPGGILQSRRKETDLPEFLSGLRGNVTCGSPITAIIRNQDAHSEDYTPYEDIPRPGHADYSALAKYGKIGVLPGGGHFSGRLTAPLCIAGGICIQALEKKGIRISSKIESIGGIANTAAEGALFSEEIRQAIEKARNLGDSLGGILSCEITGAAAGLGNPIFDGMENRLSQVLFGIPAVKGLEFGSGFESASLRGSENNDAYYYEDGRVLTKTNLAGGILGGITNGMPICFRLAIKPTPSIACRQETLCLSTLTESELSVRGRHDPCIVPRALPCAEAAAAIAILDAMLDAEKDDFFKD